MSAVLASEVRELEGGEISDTVIGVAKKENVCLFAPLHPHSPHASCEIARNQGIEENSTYDLRNGLYNRQWV